MSPSTSHVHVVAPDEHILTVQEALEPLYMQLEREAEAKLLQAAVSAGWSAEEALEAIDELKRNELEAIATQH